MSTLTSIQNSLDYAITSRSVQVRQRPGFSGMLVLAADALGLRMTLWLFFGHSGIGRHAVLGEWLHLWPLVSVFLLVYCLFDLYPGISVCPVDEIRRVFLANTSVFIFVSAILSLHQETVLLWVICLSACVFASVEELVMRTAVRHLGSHFNWWGYPVVLFGSGAVAREVLRKLKSQPQRGLRPVAVITSQPSDRRLEGVPVYELESLDGIASSGVRHAIVAAPESTRLKFVEVMERAHDTFPHLILIPDIDSIWKVGAHSKDLAGFLGLQIKNNLLLRQPRIAKRAFDLVCAALLILLLTPLLTVISIFVFVESGFPVLYFQKRLGYGGRTFYICKFRTMVRDSAEVLEKFLERSPKMQREWAESRKLREDPRITRVGKLLRKASLDELPQLWNVLRGDMSLVGPRPIVRAEVNKYQEAYFLYEKVTPGLTGLWQVSGRNRTTYEERVAFDTYYVRNWSVWMDLYLLARTVSVVITGYGAC